MTAARVENPGEVSAAYLHPGRVLAHAQDLRVVTILGSCVAVGLWDPTTGAGGMIHFVLPRAPGVGARDPARYGDTGIALMIERIRALGASASGLRAKVFGGAGVLRGNEPDGGRLGVENVEIALRRLIEARIPIVAVETGGERGRKVQFHTGDGSAWVKQV